MKQYSNWYLNLANSKALRRQNVYTTLSETILCNFQFTVKHYLTLDCIMKKVIITLIYYKPSFNPSENFSFFNR